MEKRLLAVAVAGALAAPAIALAQSTVQIYGRATIEYGKADGGAGRKNPDFLDGPGGSAIGFKGVEQLGGGLSAWFQCESSADLTGYDTSSICTRNSALGFRGGFGNIFAGKWDTPFKRAMGVGDVGGEATGILGMSFLPFGGSGGADGSGTGVDSVQRQRWKRRESNLITYETPKFGGFQVMAGMSAGNRAGSAGGGTAVSVTSGDPNGKPRIWSLGGTYVNGPLGIGLAYEKHNEFGAHQTGSTQELDDRAWGVTVGYRFGPVRVGASYLDAKYETGGGTEAKKKTWVLGAEWNIAGPHTVSLLYANAGDTKGNSTTRIGGAGTNGAVEASGNNTGGDAWSLAYMYRFSKRTTVKLGYVRVDNDSNSTAYRVGNTQSLLQAGENVDGYAVLVKHNF